LAWQIGDRTDLTVNLEYFTDDDPYNAGTVAFGGGIADIPLERLTNNPNDTIQQDYFNLGYTLEHRFSDNWQLRNQFRYVSQDVDFSVIALPFDLDETTGILNRLFADQIQESDTYALYTNVQGEFSTGPVDHTLLFGVDLARTENYNETVAAFDPLTPINIFDPEPDYFAVPAPDTADLGPFNNTDSTIDRLGIYLQDQIDILDNLIVVAGLRYDTVNQDTTDFLSETETTQYDDAVSPRIGIVYQPIAPISLYANYSRSFTPSLATDADGEPLAPEEGEGFEVGIRGEIIENRLAATLAYFDITKQNVATADPNDLFASVATGEQRSRGVDFDLTGEILPGWNVIASYAYIDAEVTEDNTDIVGNRLLGVPEHSASLWTTYEIQAGDFEGLGFGLGFNFVGERAGDLDNSFEVDSYFLTNAAVFYRQENWQFRLNVDNLFDVDYIESVGRDRTREIYPGNPLTVRASVSYTF
jgi:iron complex outermembrane receptor protein